jgi:membrane fusion protein
MSRDLFRSEALANKQDRLHGGVLIARSPTIRFLVSVTVLFAIAVACFAYWGQYNRKEHVVGYLMQ